MKSAFQGIDDMEISFYLTNADSMNPTTNNKSIRINPRSIPANLDLWHIKISFNIVANHIDIKLTVVAVRKYYLY